MKINIELTDDGQLKVGGDCLQNKVMALGMIELTKKMILDAPLKVAAPPIEVASPEASKALLNGRR